VVIPEGHPLYKFLTSSLYRPVLSEYLALASDLSVCTYHTNAATATSADPIVQNTLIPDAQTLISSAQSLLNGLDSSGTQYASILQAINNLQYVINQDSPSSADVAGAMSLLTQAMALAY